jgi:hypothetical protein
MEDRMVRSRTADELEFPELVAMIRRLPPRSAAALAGIATGQGNGAFYHPASLRALVARGLVREGSGSIPTPHGPLPMTWYDVTSDRVHMACCEAMAGREADGPAGEET